MEQAWYYSSQKDKLLKELAGFAKLMQPELAARYGEQLAIKIRQDTLAEYEKLLPQFPYIGGKANPLTTNLVRAGYVLALYRALQAQGGAVEEVGELSCLAQERKLKQIPAFVRRWMGQFAYSPARVRKMQVRAQASQARRYPGDWVFEVIEGDGQTFDVAMTYTECGIDKFMRSQGAEELTPYLCNLDYVTFAACGMGLVRTKTLGWGCDCCDFHIQRKGIASPAWPPRFTERTCGEGGRDEKM
ncbi:MAG: L-2-amino-thiazoline-4-carboxylic acid hydrolase [Anaerolineae bacterium]|nr:L-2-amino-thiazoline-4-carboxylic acid hydrolase [Anaerolineae bacterium]